MKIVFCAEPFAPTLPDSAYADEVTAARAAGFETVLIDFEALVNDRDVRAAVRRVQPSDQPMPAVYRGWMLKPALYAELDAALKQRGLLLINDPVAYQHCHYLPESYSIIAAHTPRTIALPLPPNAPLPDLAPLLQPFGDRPLIVKDYVKSRKHEWHEACFMPSAADQPAVRRVVQRFVELQGDDLNAGLVFREFVELQPLAQHSKSGMPLTQEFRLWFVDGQRIFSSQYWEEGTYTTSAPDDLFADVARQVQSRFFTMDVARTLDGGWLIVELGDGQVAGLPDTAEAALFYRVLHEALAP